MVDGGRVPVLADTYALTRIPVPAGDHEVHFVFDPASARASHHILSILMAVALTVLAELRP
jgi:hypothetical protein